MLLNLTNDFMRFLNTENLHKKKQHLAEMNDYIQARTKKLPHKKLVKGLFQNIYKRQLEHVIQIGLDEKNENKLSKALFNELVKNDEVELYNKLIMACDSQDLEQWSRDVVKSCVDDHNAVLKAQE